MSEEREMSGWINRTFKSELPRNTLRGIYGRDGSLPLDPTSIHPHRKLWGILEFTHKLVPAAPGKQSEKGFTLIEVLLAAFILITVGVGILAGLTLTSRVVISTDHHETARDIAVAEMEYIKSLSYNASHYNYNPDLIPSNSGYTVSVVNPPQSLQDGNLQVITVIVYSKSTEITRLSGYKVNW
jgi:Tfp pilus assembly protein PilV